jgi:hypothetical protein
MFISNKEKARINDILDVARINIEGLKDKVLLLEERIRELEKKPVTPVTPDTVVKVAKKPMTALQKAKQRVYQMEYKQRIKDKKLAEQGKTNVSA